jgi:hypothetical protein
MIMKKLLCSILIMTILGVQIGLELQSWAQAPKIIVDLSFAAKSNYYRSDDPIPLTITVTNISGEDILISKGFQSKLYHLAMRMIDPTGRLLIPKSCRVHREVPDAPPLPFVQDRQGKHVRAAPCEVFAAKSPPLVQKIGNLKEFYDMELAGPYSTQVQLSAMVFRPGVCDINNFQWSGVFKSEPKYFYVEGKTIVRIIPDQWNIDWRYKPPPFPIEVRIYPAAGKTVNDYVSKTIRLNNVAAIEFAISNSILTAYFEAGASVKSLGEVEVGRPYPVTITGRLKNDQPFGGGRRITIENK